MKMNKRLGMGMLMVVLILLAIDLSAAWQNCAPIACQQGYVDGGVQCNANARVCTRTCSINICDDNTEREVFHDADALKWDSGDTTYNNGDIKNDYAVWSQTFSPQAGKCYKFGVLGSNARSGGENGRQHNDLQVDSCNNHVIGRGCDNEDLRSYCALGFGDGTWLSTLPAFSLNGATGTGYLGSTYREENVDNRYSNTYTAVSDFDDTVDDFSDVENIDGWYDGLDCNDDSGWQYIYCTQSQAECNTWGKGPCGFGCVNNPTSAWTTQGVYIDENIDDENVESYENMQDAIFDNGYDDYMIDNEYFPASHYKVWEYAKRQQQDNRQCNMLNEAPNLQDFAYNRDMNTGAFNIDLWGYTTDVDSDRNNHLYVLLGQNNFSLTSCQIANAHFLSCTAPAQGQWGVNRVDLRVTDQHGNIDTGRATININWVPTPPTITFSMHEPAKPNQGERMSFAVRWVQGSDDDARIVVCSTNRTNNNGNCRDRNLCTGNYTSNAGAGCWYTVGQNENDFSAYLFMCDRDNNACSAGVQENVDVNRKPIANAPSLSAQNPPNTETIFTCTPNGGNDPDGDQIAVEQYQWYLNGGIVQNEGSENLNCETTLGCIKGRRVECTVRYRDTNGFSSDWSGKSNAIVVENSLPTFVQGTAIQGAGTQNNPVDEGQTITFTATTADLDNEPAKLMICETNRLQGLNCADTTYCEGGMILGQGKQCIATTNGARVENEYFSYVCDNERCRAGASGTFYVKRIRVKNLKVEVAENEIFSQQGDFMNTAELSFADELNHALEDCAPDTKGYCMIPLTFSGEGPGRIQVSTLDIDYVLVNEPPLIQEIQDITVTEGDQVIVPVLYTDPDDWNPEVRYEGPMNSPQWQTQNGDAGEHTQRIRVSDGELQAETNFVITVLENEVFDDRCRNVACQDYCDGTTLKSSGQCDQATGVCVYQQITPESLVCGYVPPRCMQDSDCGIDGSRGQPFCGEGEQATSILQRYAHFTCENPATLRSECTEREEPRTLEVCDFRCQEGACLVQEEQEERTMVASYEPESVFTMHEGEERVFSIVLVNQERERIPAYNWQLDGSDVSSASTYTYRPGFEDAGRHIITLQLNAEEQEELIRWEIDVQDVTIQNKPDLRIRNLKVLFPRQPRIGQQTFITFEIENKGKERAEGINWAFDPLHRNDELSQETIHSEELLQLNVDQKAVVNVEYTYQNRYEGNIYTKVDYDNSIVEEFEDNNEQTRQITVLE